ncbi:MAG: MaoC family dehydratase N-terminal domain-containing protein [Bifidobacteriaceae bacterium]|nr:MaoC family dehydratase N-terminal domain-containing protein [Bifidobacteriaceae bacterium]
MGVNGDYVGRIFVLPRPYEVEASTLRAFARAVGVTHPACHDSAAARALGYSDVVAAPTFGVVIAQKAEALYLSDPGARIDCERVVHAEERFVHTRPLVAGDVVGAATEVVGIISRGGITQVTTRSDLTDEADGHRGVPVASVWSTLAVRAERR